jgi:hypothetical protein
MTIKRTSVHKVVYLRVPFVFEVATDSMGNDPEIKYVDCVWNKDNLDDQIESQIWELLDGSDDLREEIYEEARINILSDDIE